MRQHPQMENNQYSPADMQQLENLYNNSPLAEVLQIKIVDTFPDKKFSALRFKSNDYRLRAIEIWNRPIGRVLRIYHSNRISPSIKNEIDDLPGNRVTSTGAYTDYIGNFQEIVNKLGALLKEDAVIGIAKSSPIFTRNSAWDGLILPDVDTSDVQVLGRTFTWKELIAIDEDESDENQLKAILSRSGVYLQRSLDGKSRYVGAAFGDGGILARWLKHLSFNGNAKHLNIFVLENGYANVLFTVLEFVDCDQVLRAEARWKSTLGTKNNGPYDGARLNNN